MKFAEKLKKLRSEKGLTQQGVATAAGITKRTYASYETDGRYPRDREVYGKLAAVLGCETNYLMTEQYGSRGKKQAEELVNELAGMFAGGELSDDDMDGVMIALQKAYFKCKEDNKKYTPKKYRKES